MVVDVIDVTGAVGARDGEEGGDDGEEDDEEDGDEGRQSSSIHSSARIKSKVNWIRLIAAGKLLSVRSQLIQINQRMLLSLHKTYNCYQNFILNI